MLEKQPAMPTAAPVIIPTKEAPDSYMYKPEQYHSAPPVIQPIKDPATEEKEVGLMMSCDIM